MRRLDFSPLILSMLPFTGPGIPAGYQGLLLHPRFGRSPSSASRDRPGEVSCRLVSAPCHRTEKEPAGGEPTGLRSSTDQFAKAAAEDLCRPPSGIVANAKNSPAVIGASVSPEMRNCFTRGVTVGAAVS